MSEEHHHLRPLSRGGLTIPRNMRWLCANAHSDVHAYLNLIERGRGHVAWEAAQHFGPNIRRLARDGWDQYAVEFLRGDWARHAWLWETSGAGRQPMVPPYSHTLETRQLPKLLLRASDAMKAARL